MLLVAAVSAVAVGVAVRLIPAYLRQQEVRGAIAVLRGGPREFGERRVTRALERLDRLGARELRHEADDLFAALEALPLSSIDFADPVCALLARIAEEDPDLAARARRRPALEPYVFRALLMTGRADLACPEPRVGEFGLLHGHELSVDIGAHNDTLPSGSTSHFELADGSPPRILLVAGAGEVCALARLGPGAPDLAAAPPPEGDPRWRTGPANEGVAVAAAGETYAFHARSGPVDATGVFHVVELREGHARIRWKITEARRLAGALPREGHE